MDAAQSLAWKDIATWAFCMGWGAIGLYVAGTLKSVSKSVQELNINVAVVIEKVSNHEGRIEHLEDRADKRKDAMVDHENRIEKLEDA